MTDTSAAATGDDVAKMGENSGDTVRGQEDGRHPDLPYVSSDDVDGTEQATPQSTDAVDTGANAGSSDTPGLGDMDDVVPGAGTVEPPD